MKIQQNLISISVRPERVARFLGAIALFLVIASTIGQSIAYINNFTDYPLNVRRLLLLFEMGSEHNIPTHFSALLLLTSAILLYFIFLINRNQSDWSKSYWMVLSTGFLFMAADEAYQIHEKLIHPFRALLGNEDLGIFYFAWVIPYFGMVLLLGIFFYSFLQRLAPPIRNMFLLAASIYLGGAIGLELVGGYYAELYGGNNFTYSMIQTVEETLEITGLIIFIRTLFQKVGSDFKELQVTF